MLLETADAITARERWADAPSLAHKLGIAAFVAVQAAAKLPEMSGFEREDAVLDFLVREFVGEDADENAWEKFMDDLTPLDGWRERATDFAWEVLPVEKLAESHLRTGIRIAYSTLKGVGVLQ